MSRKAVVIVVDVIAADDAPAAEACICKPCSAGHAQERK